jgi:multiple sugar transport system permease protein
MVRADRFFPKNKVITLVLLVAALYFALVLWWPILQTFAWSLSKKFLFNFEWVGFENYRVMFTDDQIFWKAFRNTIVYALMVVPPVVIIGMFLAILVNSIANRATRGVLTASYFVAYIVPLVAVAVVWRYIFEPSRIGLLNAIFGALGWPQVRWLASPDTALLSLAIVSVWKNVGYVLVIYLAGLQAIPRMYYEAAQIDGANRVRRFRHITLPLLTPAILFATALTTIGAFMMFVETYVMTRQSGSTEAGGPIRSTTTLALYVYQSAFGYQKEGYASAIAVVLFIMVVAVTLVQFKFIRTDFEY